MSEPEEKPVEEPAKPVKTAKAEFSVSEKKVKIEKLPELEGVKESGGKEKVSGAVPGSKPPVMDIHDFRNYLMVAFDKWNEYLTAPTTGDPRERYKLTAKDADLLLTATSELDKKYHFLGEWTRYYPELMMFIVAAGILGKVLMGMRYKQNTEQNKPAASQQTYKEAKPSGLDRIKEALSPKPRADEGAFAGIPPELVKDARETIQGQTQASSKAAQP